MNGHFYICLQKMDKGKGKLLSKAAIKVAKCVLSLVFVHSHHLRDKKELVEMNRTLLKSM